MAKLSTLLDEYKKQHSDSSNWAVADTDTMLLISGISSREAADSLMGFLAGEGLTCTLSMGDKKGTTWNLAARPAVAGPPEEAE